ncbi:MAG: multiheme c-type cytochrome [Terriglobia bacterium]
MRRLSEAISLVALGIMVSAWCPAHLGAADAAPEAPHLDVNAAPEGSRACLQCHIAKGITGSAIRDWQLSKHFGAGVACANCHIPVKDASPGILNATTACEDKRVRRGVSPRNCAVCHAEKFEQFSSGRHSVAWGAMVSMPSTAVEPHALVEGMKGCGGCHRVGLDEGKCDSCHTRHRFSAAEARRPEACLPCHMGVDHPQWEMYSTSKHGAIYNIEGAAHWNWELGLGDWFKDPTHASPERPRTPVCATCHMPNGDHAVRAAWGFLGLRLPEKDPEWLQYRQKILVALGILTPDGQPTPRAQVVKVGGPPLTAEEWQAERDRRISVCVNCHARSFARQNLEAADSIIKDSDKLVAEAIDIVEGLYHDGILERPKDRPPVPDLLLFYDLKAPIEQKLYTMILEHRMRGFQGAFHMNPDYQHWYGYAEIKHDLAEISEDAAQLRASHPKASGGL